MKKGFTLCELLTIISIIAILAGLLLPALKNARRSGLYKKATLGKQLSKESIQELKKWVLKNSNSVKKMRAEYGKLPWEETKEVEHPPKSKSVKVEKTKPKQEDSKVMNRIQNFQQEKEELAKKPQEVKQILKEIAESKPFEYEIKRVLQGNWRSCIIRKNDGKTIYVANTAIECDKIIVLLKEAYQNGHEIGTKEK